MKNILRGAIVLGAFLFILLGVQINFGVFNFAGAENVANLSGEPVDLIGTMSGTTTTGVYLDRITTASTTYPFYITNGVNDVSIYFKVVTASGTPDVSMNIYGSNDKSCNTATTTTIYNVVTTGQVNWYDVGYATVRELAGSAVIPGATSTITWSPVGNGANKVVHLTDVNSKCLAVVINGASTTVYAQYMTK